MSAPNPNVTKLLGSGLGSFESLIVGLSWCISQVSAESDDAVDLLQPLGDVLAAFDTQRPPAHAPVRPPVLLPEPVQQVLFRAGLALCEMRQLARTGQGGTAEYEELRQRAVKDVRMGWSMMAGEVLP